MHVVTGNSYTILQTHARTQVWAKDWFYIKQSLLIKECLPKVLVLE